MAAAIRINGKTLKEQDGIVALPFGSEYSVFIKNVNSVKAKAKVSIDGEDVTDGWVVIEPNSSINLERYIRNGNLSKGNKFKFIERTDKIEENRGVKVDDGIVRVEFKFAKKIIDSPEVRRYPVYEPYYVPFPKPYWVPYPNWNYYPTLTCSTSNINNSYSAQSLSNSANSGNQNQAQNMMRCTGTSLSRCADNGITVAGSESQQQFVSVSDFNTESTSHVIVLKLKGFIGSQKVESPIMKTEKTKCSTCGTFGKPNAKFCSECGTSLILF